MKRPPLVACLAACAALVPGAALAARRQPDLTRASLEDLMNVEITAAARAEQRVEDTAAAVYVITQEEIQRSGLTSIPELFRLVPGMQVAQINANKWAVSARGFNDLFSNKLLVLIDGRSIYNRSFSGVFWEDLDLHLADVERIEVVRGPRGSMWGANAVNAVINIVTKPAAATTGANVELSAGTFDRSQLSARYGVTDGRGAYRVYSQWSDRRESLTAAGDPAGDRWQVLTAGARADWTFSRDAVMLQGGFNGGDGRSLWRRSASPLPGAAIAIGDDSDSRTGFALGRWNHGFVDGGALQVQSFYNAWRRTDGQVRDDEVFMDVDVQYERRIGRHELMAGGETRDVDSTFDGTFEIALTPPRVESNTNSLFAQDRFQITRRLTAIAGTKVEHNTGRGWNVQPTLRAIWNVGTQQVWGAFSRSVRTPSALDLGRRNNVAFADGPALPVLVAIVGNPDYRDERLLLAETGYRIEASPRLSLDVTAFRGVYDGLATLEPLPPTLEAAPAPAHLLVASRLENLLRADTAGIEVSARWVPHRSTRLDASYSALQLTPHPDAASRDERAPLFDGNAPAHQWQLRSSTWLTRRTEASVALYHTGRIASLDTPAYTRADARLEYRVTNTLSIAAIGQNLQAASHAEFTDPRLPIAPSLVPRSARVQLQWNLK